MAPSDHPRRAECYRLLPRKRTCAASARASGSSTATGAPRSEESPTTGGPSPGRSGGSTGSTPRTPSTRKPSARRSRSRTTTCPFPGASRAAGRPRSGPSSTTATTLPRSPIAPTTGGDVRGTSAKGGSGGTTTLTAASGSAKRSPPARKRTWRGSRSTALPIEAEAGHDALQLEREVEQLLGGARHLGHRRGLLDDHLAHLLGGRGVPAGHVGDDPDLVGPRGRGTGDPVQRAHDGVQVLAPLAQLGHRGAHRLDHA